MPSTAKVNINNKLKIMTAMQDLRQDLQETIDKANNALLEIQNDGIRLACQEVVKLTIQNIIKRIDEELLEMEKNQYKSLFDALDNLSGAVSSGNPHLLSEHNLKAKVLINNQKKWLNLI